MLFRGLTGRSTSESCKRDIQLGELDPCLRSLPAFISIFCNSFQALLRQSPSSSSLFYSRPGVCWEAPAQQLSTRSDCETSRRPTQPPAAAAATTTHAPQPPSKGQSRMFTAARELALIVCSSCCALGCAILRTVARSLSRSRRHRRSSSGETRTNVSDRTLARRQGASPCSSGQRKRRSGLTLALA